MARLHRMMRGMHRPTLVNGVLPEEELGEEVTIVKHGDLHLSQEMSMKHCV